MYAIVKSGGHQYRVSQGDVIDVERLPASAGDKITIDQILLVGTGSGVKVGQPLVEGASVSATVVGEVKDKKIVVFKYRPKNRYRVKTGHRQKLTRLKIDSIEA
jgi:large subunit ribosomal protein L21